jgi:hypothetical protein
VVSVAFVSLQERRRRRGDPKLGDDTTTCSPFPLLWEDEYPDSVDLVSLLVLVVGPALSGSVFSLEVSLSCPSKPIWEPLRSFVWLYLTLRFLIPGPVPVVLYCRSKLVILYWLLLFGSSSRVSSWLSSPRCRMGDQNCCRGVVAVDRGGPPGD